MSPRRRPSGRHPGRCSDPSSTRFNPNVHQRGQQVAHSTLLPCGRVMQGQFLSLLCGMIVAHPKFLPYLKIFRRLADAFHECVRQCLQLAPPLFRLSEGHHEISGKRCLGSLVGRVADSGAVGMVADTYRKRGTWCAFRARPAGYSRDVYCRLPVYWPCGSGDGFANHACLRAFDGAVGANHSFTLPPPRPQPQDTRWQK